MCFNDAFAYGKAKSGAIGFVGNEGSEYVPEAFLWNTAAVILYTDSETGIVADVVSRAADFGNRGCSMNRIRI